jgi:hypothetical protein
LPALPVRLETRTIQAFDAGERKYDIILLHNSINHLDEAACIDLKENSNSRAIYKGIFAKISSFGVAGTELIISDCSRYNFFHLLGVKNPFAPHIEWHKHQSPMLWVRLLEQVGFRNPEVTWVCPDQLRSPGQALLGNQVMSFFLGSYFLLRMEKGVEEIRRSGNNGLNG